MTTVAEHDTRYRLTFGRVVRSEWTKMFSLRHRWVVLAGVAPLSAGMSALISWNGGGQRPTPPLVPEAVGGGFLVFALLIGVLGLLMMSGEYGSGLIRVTVVAVPRRVLVLWAKALVLVAATFPVMVVAYLGAFLGNQAFVDPGARIAVTDPAVVAAVLGAAGATAAAGLIGLSVGTLVRSTAGAVLTYVIGLVIVPPVVISILPAALRDVIAPYLPSLALQAMFAGGGLPGPMLDPGAGAIVVLGWVMLLLAGSATMLRRRDV